MNPIQAKTVAAPRKDGRPAAEKPFSARRVRGLRAQGAARGEGLAALLFLLPSVGGICLFFLFPFVDTLWRSLHDTSGNNFTGLQSYQNVLGNEAFKLAAANTARFVGVCIPLLLVLSLALALGVRATKKGARSFKTTYLLPMAVPVASVVLLWKALFAENGLANTLLTSLGAQPVSFMASDAAFWVLVGTYLWKNSGYDMILWLSGLDGIPQSRYEAAMVDGCGALKCFRYITLPALIPTAGMVAILSLLNSFKVFREAHLVAGSYPHDSIYLLQHLFNNWYQNLDISRLCAAAAMLCVVLLGIILLVQRFFQEEDSI